MGVGDCSGTNEGQSYVVSCLDDWKGTVDECLNGLRLYQVDLIQRHSLVLGQGIEKVSKHDVECRSTTL